MVICKKCKLSKTEDAFYKHPKSANGLSSYCRPCNTLVSHEWRRKNPEKVAHQRRTQQQLTKVTVMQHYSRGTPRCSCCGERELAFLAMDHIHGNGHVDRKRKLVGIRLWSYLKTNNYPSGFQVLCMNCNWGKYTNGVCPHQKARVEAL
jgi:hypothetical protein